MTLRIFRIFLRFLLIAGGWVVPLTAGNLSVRGAEPGAEYSMRQWHVPSEFANDEILALSQSPAGYLQLASGAGLGRFDGSQFRFTPVAANGLPETSTIAALIEAPDFGFVVAPSTGGLWVAARDHFVRATFAAELGDRVVIALFAAPDRALWAGCSDGTVFRFTNEGVKKFLAPRGLPGPRKISFATDALNQVWVTSDLNLLRYQDNQLQVQQQVFEGTELRIASSRVGGPWILTPDRLYKLTGKTFEVQASVPPLLGSHYVQALVEDRRGVLWLGTRSNGLHAFENNQLHPLPELGEDIYALLEDNEGNVWVGTNGNGLARLRPKNYQLINKSSGLLVDFSTTVCEDVAGNIWMANRDGGVVSWRDGVLTKHGQLPDWPTYSAVSVLPGAQGGISFTCGSGVYRITSTAADAPIRKEDDFPVVPIIRCTYLAHNGDAWFSADPGKLGRRHDRHCDLFALPESYASAEIHAISEDAEGHLLVAVAGELLSFDGQRFHQLLPEVHARWGALQCILAQADGSILFGTEQAGVVQWRRDGRLLPCGADRGMVHNNITQIIPDDFGNLWFGSAGGIFRIALDDLSACLEGRSETVRPLVISQDRGAGELACIAQYQPGAWKARDGRLWFATRRGILEINPAAEMAPLKPAVAAIDEVRSDGKILPLSNAIQLRSDLSKIEIHFSALSLSTPERVQLEYQLVGFDHDWIAATVDRVATYPRLPPGRYPFRVAARMINDASTVSRVGVDFIIVPFWWQTWWFRTLASAVIAGLLVQAVRVRSHRRLRRRLEALERAGAIERERSRIARNIHDEVGASLTRISLLTQSGAHGASTDASMLTKIHQTTREVTRSLDEIVWAIDPRHDNLESLVAYFVSYAQNFLGAAGVRCRLEIPDNLPLLEPTTQIRHNLFLCQKEALHNIVKHAHAAEVMLSLHLERSVLSLTIADDGVGFEASGRNGAEAERDSDRISAGNGLANMRHHIEEVGGKMEVGPGLHGRGMGITWTLELSPTEVI